MLFDLRHACRLLVRVPGFTTAAVLILALGIGANTAVFTIVRAVLLRPLPYHEPDRLVYLWNGLETRPGNQHGILTGRHLVEYSTRNATLDSFAVVKSWESGLDARIDLYRPDGADRLRGAFVTPNFFDLLGVKAALGRTLVQSDDAGDPVVVLSDALWRRRFGADLAIIGQRLSLVAGRVDRATTSYLVVGILPEGFRFTYPDDTELYALWPWSGIHPNRALEYQMIARLKPGVTAGQAQAELTAVAKDIVRGYGIPTQFREAAIARAAALVEPMPEHLKREVRPGVLLLAAVAGLVLLIGCVNLGLLVMARTVDRGRELAVRSALGAAPRQIVRQLIAEGATLGLAGGAVGTLAAAVLLPVLRSIMPPVVPRGSEIGIDWQVLAFAIGATAITTLVCGLTPAWLALRRDVQSALRQASGTATADRALSKSRSLVVGVQVAVVLILLVGASLLLKSFWRMQHVDLGFNARGIITMEMRLISANYRQPGRIAAFEQDLLARVREVPGVEQASLTTAVPMRGVDFLWVVGPKGGRTRPGNMRSVDPDYFRLMRVPLRAGRLFTRTDTAASQKVMIVSESYGRSHFGSQSALGRALDIDGNQTEIVGVVGDVRMVDVTRDAAPAFYLPRSQQPNELLCLLVSPAAGAGARVVAGVRAAIQSLDPEQPVEGITTIDAILAQSTSEKRFYALATGAFAGVALLLAVAGLFGVVSRSVTERRREIAIRMALGADRLRLQRLVFGYGLTPVIAGIVLGLATALAGSRVLRGFLFEIGPTDPATYVGAAALVALVATAACYLPARRAIRIEPMAVLKSE